VTLATPPIRKKFWGARTQKVLNLVVSNVAVVCRRMSVWVVLLLFSMLLPVYWQVPSADSSRSLSITECWSY